MTKCDRHVIAGWFRSQIRLRDVFDRYDYNRNGRLEARELARLVRDLLPGATEADFNYLLVGGSAAVRTCLCLPA